jgi:DNA-binding MarR family transcriptional regulator
MDVVNQCLCISLRRSAQLVSEYYDALLAPSGLKVTQFSLLEQIRHREPVSISELARLTGLDRTTMGKNLRLMAGSDLVSLSPGGDRRERIAQMTSKGRQALKSAYPLWEKAQATLTETLGQEQVGTLQSLLAQLDRQLLADNRIQPVEVE